FALNGQEDTSYISNWESRTISVIDTKNYSLLGIIPVNGIPRGMVVSDDESLLYAANFTSGDINKIDTVKMELIKNIDLGDGALRHIVISDDKSHLFVSDMYYGTVSILNLDTDRVEKSFYAGNNINTIKILNGKNLLFISSRGRNSKNGYLQKGPVFGKIYLYDISAGEITDWTWGGNQPTGLAVSPFGDIIAFTDFLDHRIEVYKLGIQQNPVKSKY
ncbi:MAG: YncE family protein, partial [Spirochaetales bacterium]|nr:YncE family protein [Spirochaetales bacterium]